MEEDKTLQVNHMIMLVHRSRDLKVLKTVLLIWLITNEGLLHKTFKSVGL